MVSTQRHALLLVLITAVQAAGLLDALISRAWDFVAVFSIGLLLIAAAIVQSRRGRRPIRLRPDLATWLEHEAASRAESVETLADRAVAAYRAGLSDGS